MHPVPLLVGQAVVLELLLARPRFRSPEPSRYLRELILSSRDTWHLQPLFSLELCPCAGSALRDGAPETPATTRCEGSFLFVAFLNITIYYLIYSKNIHQA